MKDLISIIVPIYGVEKYIAGCIESLINQTYKNLEIILVDDGSIDNSGAICDEYAKKDQRIIVIHKKNEGVATARNEALKIATGDYLGFVDGDDTVNLKMYEKMLKLMQKYDSDIVMCSHQKVSSDELGNIIIPKLEDEHEEYIVSKSEALKSMILDGDVGNFACTKLFKKELFDGITYPDGKVYEDVATTYRVVDKANKIVYTNERLYNYLYGRNGSITSSFTPKKILDSLDAYYDQYVFLSERYSEIIDYLKVGWIKMYTSAMEKICINNYEELWQEPKVLERYDSFKFAIDTVEKDLLNKYLEPYRVISAILLGYDKKIYKNMIGIITNNIKYKM